MLPHDRDDRFDDAGSLARMIAAQQQALARLGTCPSTSALCAERTALEESLAYLRERFAEAAPAQAARAQTPLEAAKKLAEVEGFAVPPSHRGRAGGAVTAVKRAAVEGLAPFHVEMLRPQRAFNRAVIRALEELGNHRALKLQDDLSEWIRDLLAPLLRTSAQRVQSHRPGPIGSAVTWAKRGYLASMSPVLERVLEGQRTWNEQIAAALEDAARGGVSGAAAAARIALLEGLAEAWAPLTRHPLLRVSSPVWREVLRQQVRFNHEVTLALSDLLGVRPPPPEGARAQDYPAWIAAQDRLRSEEARAFLTSASEERKISVLTSADPEDLPNLLDTLASLREQSFGAWELVICTGPSISAEQRERLGLGDGRVRLLVSNEASTALRINEALAAAAGEWVVFLEPGDRLADFGLALLARELSSEGAPDALYADEDVVTDTGTRTSPFFKPDFSPDLLRSVDYISGLFASRRALAVELGGWREAAGGAAAYDFVLRVSERAKAVGHLAHPVLHRCEASRRSAFEPTTDGARVLSEHLVRVGEEAQVALTAGGYHVRYAVKGQPLVSIIVPFRDKPELLDQLVTSLFANTRYANFELLLVSNQSLRAETFALLDSLTDPRIRKLSWDHPFNYPAINNWAAREARGEFLLFLNNDIEILHEDWLEELLGHAQRPDIGAVGAKLLFPDGSVQHSGVVIGIQGFAAHPFWRLPEDAWTPFGHTGWVRNWLAVTSACELVSRELFEEIGGFDERFQVCGSDVELGLRLIGKGKRVLTTPHARLVHHESASRRTDAIPEVDHWQSFAAYERYLVHGDPFYSPNLTLLDTDCSFRTDPRDGQALALQALAQDLPSAKAPAAHRLAREQRHTEEHLLAWDLAPGTVASTEALAHLPALRTLCWFIPHFGQIAGGLQTIFRFAHLLDARHGVKSRFIVYDAPLASSSTVMESMATALFPTSPGPFQVLRSPEQLAELPECDLAIATAWPSAFFAMKHPRAAARAYFVQDHEPEFHPSGALSGLAEHTYRLGLYGIFNTPGLHSFVGDRYGMTGTSFIPAVDHRVFHAVRPKREGPLRVFFYGRPQNDRNAFELGIAVLRQLKERRGSRVEVISAGAAWNPEDYGLRGVIQNLGVLPYERTGALYRESDVGLCFMFTKHPSYLPFEMMACGMTVVTNDNPTNHWLFRHGENALLAAPTVSSVLSEVERALDDSALRARIGDTAASERQAISWEDQVDQVFETLRPRIARAQGS